MLGHSTDHTMRYLHAYDARFDDTWTNNRATTKNGALLTLSVIRGANRAEQAFRARRHPRNALI